MLLKKLPIFLMLFAFFQNCFSQSAEDMERFARLDWEVGPNQKTISNNATLNYGEGYVYLNPKQASEALRLMGNLPSENHWFSPENYKWFGLITDFTESGYIKDDEAIDADKLLKTLKETNKAANLKREEQGMQKVYLLGWSQPPFYNKVTNRLEWGTKVSGGDDIFINYTSRILGRHGYYSAMLITSPENFLSDKEQYNRVLTGFQFSSGNQYNEFKEGDKVAEYGLAALVAGGAVAAVAKSKGFLKGIFIAIIAGIAALWAVIKRIFTGNKK